MAGQFSDAQESDLYYLLGYPALYRQTYAALANALAAPLPADTLARVIANIASAKQHIANAVATMSLQGIEQAGKIRLNAARQYQMEMGLARRDIHVIANDLCVDVLNDVTSTTARTGADRSYAPWA